MTIDDAALRDAYERYGALYQEFYGYRLDGIPIELVRLAVIATGEAPSFAPPARRARAGRRRVRRRETCSSRPPGSSPRGSCAARRSAPGAELAGPAIVEFMDSTVVVPPGWALLTA